ncbi:hypothetical protein Patl1_22769 [Pistacia atlantica]|uniref:Uncharacterized protein n=1 Tax=Pistacia atlantica TaxID=434234 RepID=A0ACC1A2F0_9ROSI|nr:hypothetical protein Patl1_22769 [Pistacia atlantica]
MVLMDSSSMLVPVPVAVAAMGEASELANTIHDVHIVGYFYSWFYNSTRSHDSCPQPCSWISRSAHERIWIQPPQND